MNSPVRQGSFPVAGQDLVAQRSSISYIIVSARIAFSVDAGGNFRPRSSVWIEQRFPKPKVGSSNLLGGTGG